MINELKIVEMKFTVKQKIIYNAMQRNFKKIATEHYHKSKQILAFTNVIKPLLLWKTKIL